MDLVGFFRERKDSPCAHDFRLSEGDAFGARQCSELAFHASSYTKQSSSFFRPQPLHFHTLLMDSCSFPCTPKEHSRLKRLFYQSSSFILHLR